MVFEEMSQKYIDFITSIVNTRGQWYDFHDEPYEAHHIIPKCLGGLPDGKIHNLIHDNIIRLTLQEHFEAHKILAEEYPNIRGLQLSWRSMVFSKTLGYIATPEDYAIAKKMKLAPISEETRQRVSDSHKGKHLSEEQKKKISEALKGEKNPNYGKHLSSETKKKLSDLNSGENHPMYGKHLSPETKKKLSEINTGKIKPNSRNKRVQCIETGEIFASPAIAGRAIGITYKNPGSGISKCCRGKAKSVHGYHWKYYDSSDADENYKDLEENNEYNI